MYARPLTAAPNVHTFVFAHVLWRTARGACLLLFLLPSTVSAQILFTRPSTKFELSDTVQIDRADGVILGATGTRESMPG